MTYVTGKFMHRPITRHVGRLVWVILMNKIDITFCYTFTLHNGKCNKTKPFLSRAWGSLLPCKTVNTTKQNLFCQEHEGACLKQRIQIASLCCCCSSVNQLKKIRTKMTEKKLQHWTLTSHMSKPYTWTLTSHMSKPYTIVLLVSLF